jgi:magnesium transporter
MIAAMLDLQAAYTSNRMNSIMKTLTIVSTIFIPLTFAAGIYGMNFKNMPELQWEYGYPVFLLSMVIIGAWMYYYMKRKNWF